MAGAASRYGPLLVRACAMPARRPLPPSGAPALVSSGSSFFLRLVLVVLVLVLICFFFFALLLVFLLFLLLFSCFPPLPLPRVLFLLVFFLLDQPDKNRDEGGCANPRLTGMAGGSGARGRRAAPAPCASNPCQQTFCREEQQKNRGETRDEKKRRRRRRRRRR